jgi:hypothetical protein
VGRLTAREEEHVASFTADVRAALGSRLEALVLYGSAAGDEWVDGRSDVNTAVVVPRADASVLEALAPVVIRWRPHRFAVPLVLETEFLDRARDTFPIELDDIRRQHRLLAGRDVFADVTVDRAALRRECEQEGRGKLLRLRALLLDAAAAPADVQGAILASLKSFLVLLRHLLALRGTHPGPRYADALRAGEALLGPLPAMRRLLAARDGGEPTGRPRRAELAAYLEEAGRIVAALDALDA